MMNRSEELYKALLKNYSEETVEQSCVFLIDKWTKALEALGQVSGFFQDTARSNSGAIVAEALFFGANGVEGYPLFKRQTIKQSIDLLKEQLEVGIDAADRIQAYASRDK